MWTRSIPPAELALWRENGRRQFRVRMRRRGEAAWTNLSDVMGGDWVLGIRADIPTPDQVVAGFDVRLIRKAMDGATPRTVSPGISADPINQVGAQFRPFVRAGREIEVDARTGVGDSWQPWRLWLKGEVQTVEWPNDEVIARCRTLDGVLLAKQIKVEEMRGAPDPGVPIAEEIQSLINKWWTEGDKPQLRVIGNPELGIGEKPVPPGSLGEYIRRLAQSKGWDVRYLWSEPDQTYRLTLYLPPRDKTAPDYLLPVDEVFDIPGLSESREWVRNWARIPYVTEPGGIEKAVEVFDQESIDEFREQAIVIPLSEGNQIPGTESQATALGNYALHDLSRPLIEARYRTRFNPFLELHDLLAIQADGARFDQDRLFGVVGGSHEVTADDSWTDLELSGGRITGQYFAWHLFEGLQAGAEDNVYFQISNVVWDEGDDGYGTLSWDVGPRITDSFIGYAIVPAPETEAKWDQARDNLAPATSPVRLRMPRETAQRAEVGLLWLEARYEKPGLNGLATGDVHSMRIFPRTSIPAIDDQTGDLSDGAVKRREMIADGVITARAMREGIQTFNTDVVFSASSNTVVNWTAGRVALADGRTVSVAAGSTGPMPGPTWVYLDVGAPGSLQVTRNVASTQGDERILLAYARPIADPSQLAFFVPAVGLFGVNGDAISPESIRTNHIAADQVVASHIASVSLSVIQAVVNQLSAITADLGEVRTGLILNAAENPTRAIRLSDDDALPGTAVDFLDLGATGTQPVLQVGGVRVLANGDTLVNDQVVKTVRYSHHGFRVGASDMEYSSALNNTTSLAPFAWFAMPIVLPTGVVIDHMEVRAGRGSADNMCRITLYRQEITGATDPVAQIIVDTNHTGSASITFEEEVESSITYLMFVETFYVSGTAPSFEWISLKYRSHNYRQTL